MTISFDNIVGVHAKALSLRSKRAEVLATNVANADTPGFKARDLDFSAVLKSAADASELRRTSERHIATGEAGPGGATVKYRVPLSPSLDGNTVDSHLESTAFLDNAMRYRASLRFLDGKLSGVRLAIKGE